MLFCREGSGLQWMGVVMTRQLGQKKAPRSTRDPGARLAALRTGRCPAVPGQGWKRLSVAVIG